MKLKAITDAQLTWLFTERLTSHNGFRCGRRLTDNGVAGTDYTCSGITFIKDGRLLYNSTCGEPCNFICEDANALQNDITNTLRLAQLIDEARQAKPSKIGVDTGDK